MKKWILLISAYLMTTVAHAYPAVVPIDIDAITVIQLSKLQDNTVELRLTPGSITHLCSLIMRNKNHVQSGINEKMLTDFTYTRGPAHDVMKPEKNALGQYVFKFTKKGDVGLYTDTLTISTVDGQSIASHIASIYGFSDGSLLNDVGIIPGMC